MLTEGSRAGGDAPADDKFLVHPAQVSLPKGGGAIRGMGEKFAANPVTGTGSMSVPIATSPGRAGFGPQLALSYDSGAGNGPFGIGWNLQLPAITRKTDRGLPRYRDSEESDVFLLSGAEDLVPIGDAFDDVSQLYRVQRYQPRIEGAFARIERWISKSDATDIRWRSISRDNITTWYGKRPESRVADRDRIFSWLICESYDDKGNAVRYEYKAENADGVDLTRANERNRSRSAQRYLKRIKYCNKRPREENEELADRGDWLMEVVFDYGEHYAEDAQGRPTEIHLSDTHRPWPVRADSFSSHRAAFEIRTHRLCRRVLMFHHFPDELGIDDYLVRATHFVYSEDAAASFITSVVQSGYVYEPETPPPQSSPGDRGRRPGTYLKKSLPPLEFAYSKAEMDETVHDIDAASLENLPCGLDGSSYQWVDLDGEGLPGILTEQAGGWFYKRNVSALPLTDASGKPAVSARFESVQRLLSIPHPADLSGGQQLLDLAGDGQLDVVDLERPTPGFFERTVGEDWDSFVPFASLPNVAWNDPNLRFVDLTGDGHADVLVTENEVFSWYPSLAEQGFGAGERTVQADDEEPGPRLVFADGTQSIYLSDVSGDGLTDLVRIRNGEVCYWPNLGYGRFGGKVTMDNSPWFDSPDQFDQKRIRLADIDGSGTVDIIYLGKDAVHLYFNRCGNSWSDARKLSSFPRVDHLASVMTADLLGNGTACLVWSTALPADARHSLRYVDLMGGQKPHLLTRCANNLGAETEVHYAPSTKFYLADRLAGRPWITRLPFPVHVVEKVVVRDRWRKTEFASTYSYHHGYFDGIEREFRGFGRVEQVDIESAGKFAAANLASPYVTNDRTLYQPPVKTITWFHTGAAVDRRRILTQLEKEYFPNSLAAMPGYSALLAGFDEKKLAEPALDMLTDGDEWRDALRACKGMTLRQETYELDLDELEAGRHVPVKLFTAVTNNCHIRRLQTRVKDRPAVFLVRESEVLSYHYELDLTPVTQPEDVTDIPALEPDPRVAHTLNLLFDGYGNVLQSVAIGYARARPYAGPDLDGSRELIRAVQAEQHVAYTETHYTGDAIEPLTGSASSQHYRLRLPFEVLSFELTGFQPTNGRYFDLNDFRQYRLSETLPDQGATLIGDRQYHQLPTAGPEKRQVEHAVTRFFSTDLKTPLAPGTLDHLGLLYETYKLALTRSLLDAVLGAKFDADTRALLDDPAVSGYLRGASLLGPVSGANQWWMRSGIPGFSSTARQHFYLPEQYRDPFGNLTRLSYDDYDLLVRSSADALGNATSVVRFDYRVLAPAELEDINGNRTEVCFDALGMPIATAVKGKGAQADDLIGYTDSFANPDAAQTLTFFDLPALTAEGMAARFSPILRNATARSLYHFGEKLDNGVVVWGDRPAGVCTIARERHAASLTAPAVSPLQIAFECSDGGGSILMKRSQAEPEQEGGPLRWIVSGKTILNNKGKAVKQYEPYFSSGAKCCAENDEPAEAGVTPLMYYDATGRLVRTEMPDGTLSRVEFSPWHARTLDQNDTVKESRWYRERLTAAERNEPLFEPDALEEEKQEARDWDAAADAASVQEKRAAERAARHSNTPVLTHLDSLGRDVIAIAHNRAPDANGIWQDAFHATYTKLDTEGKPLWIRDARRNLIMQYIRPPKPTRAADEPDQTKIEAMPPDGVPCYDIAGNLLYQHSMDAGERWMLMDAAGKSMCAWDFNERQVAATSFVNEQRFYRTEYDGLHRPITMSLRVNNGAPQVVERFEYKDTAGSANLTLDQAANLIGQPVRHYDPSGLVEIVRRDFKGNLQEVRRTLNNQPQEALIDWQGDDAARAAKLTAETFVQISEHDALNRMTRLYNWHRGVGARVAVYEPRYNERGALVSEDLIVGTTRQPSGYDQTAGTRTTAIRSIRYDAKGQKQYLRLGNGTTTRYDYDPKTFRLRQLRTSRPNQDPPFPQTRSNLANPQILQQLLYTYDPAGNVMEMEDQAYKPVFFDDAIVEPRSLYEYDALYRLISASGRESAQGGNAAVNGDEPAIGAGFPVTDQTLRKYIETYSYDSVGNFVSMSHQVPTDSASSWTRRYETHLDSNRLRYTWHGSDRALTEIEYTYDTHGSMRNLQRVAAQKYLRWDHRDMIHSIDLGGGGTAFYQYDASKKRTRKRIERQNNSTGYWERVDLGGYELYRRYASASSSSPVEEIESHHLIEGEQRILLVDDVLIASGATNPRPDGLSVPAQTLFRYQYSNHLGSACLELDNLAQIISYEEFHPYGSSAYRTRRSGIEVPPKRYRYTGMERDEESGLNYHTARYYAAWLGRWLASDPAGIEGGLNLYEYGSGNPIRLIDQTGRQANSTPANPTPVLMRYWSYANPVPNRASVGVNVQRDHPIQVALRRMQRTAPSGTQYYSRSTSAASNELTILVETGTGRFHTEVGRLQKIIRDDVASGVIRSESELIERTRAAYAQVAANLNITYAARDLDEVLLSNQAAIHLDTAQTASELSKEIGAKPVDFDPVMKQLDDAGAKAPPPQNPGASWNVEAAKNAWKEIQAKAAKAPAAASEAAAVVVETAQAAASEVAPVVEKTASKTAQLLEAAKTEALGVSVFIAENAKYLRVVGAVFAVGGAHTAEQKLLEQDVAKKGRPDFHRAAAIGLLVFGAGVVDDVGAGFKLTAYGDTHYLGVFADSFEATGMSPLQNDVVNWFLK